MERNFGQEQETFSEQWELSNTFEDMDKAVEDLRNKAKDQGWSEEELEDFVDVAFREALANAIIHGNLGVEKTAGTEHAAWVELVREKAQTSDKKIKVGVNVTPGEIRVSIKDEGKGFEPREVSDPTAEGLMKNSGRGLLFIRTYSDEAELSEGGTRITLVKRRNI